MRCKDDSGISGGVEAHLLSCETGGGAIQNVITGILTWCVYRDRSLQLAHHCGRASGVTSVSTNQGGYRENGILVFSEMIESEGSTTLVMPTPSGRGHFSHSVGAIRIWVTLVVESLSPGLHSYILLVLLQWKQKK